MRSKLQYISQGNSEKEQLLHIQQALDAGCNWIQLRFKEKEEREITLLATKVKMLCEKYQAIFIVNDHVRIAKEIDADGVHLGLEDMLVEEARKLLEPNKIIGGTANTIEHVRQRMQEKCDYVGLGPFRFTQTKKKLSPVLGIEGYKKISDELNGEYNFIPVYAIGGIELNDIEPIMKTGIHGIAVSGLITNAKEKKEVVKQINAKLYGQVKNS